MREIIDRGIEAILPVYIDNRGNSTLIYTKDKTLTIDKSCRTVIRNICRHYHFDIKESNKFYGKILSIKKHHPIPLDKNLVMIQVKTRIPIGKHDGAYGYINLNAIGDTKKSINNMDRSIIYLKCGQEIEIYCKKPTLDKKISNGYIVKRLIKDPYSPVIREDPTIYREEDQPATKSDIAMVYMKLNEIIKSDH